jgi:hypothetical protein
MVKGTFCKILYSGSSSSCSFDGDGGNSRVVVEVHLVEVVVSTVDYSTFVVKKERSDDRFFENESWTMDALHKKKSTD